MRKNEEKEEGVEEKNNYFHKGYTCSPLFRYNYTTQIVWIISLEQLYGTSL